TNLSLRYRQPVIPAQGVSTMISAKHWVPIPIAPIEMQAQVTQLRDQAFKVNNSITVTPTYKNDVSSKSVVLLRACCRFRKVELRLVTKRQVHDTLRASLLNIRYCSSTRRNVQIVKRDTIHNTAVAYFSIERIIC